MSKVTWKTDINTSKRMSEIKTKRNKPERALAKALWKAGIRYRLNYKMLPGTPDIALTKYQIAIFIDGEFWHGKDFEERKNDIKSNRELWIKKIEHNIEHDKKINESLKQMGWIVVRFWGKDVLKDTENCVDIIRDYINFQTDGMSIT